MVVITPLLLSALVIWIYMTLWWLVAVINKRFDIADIAWGLGFIVISVYNLYSNTDGQGWVMALLVMIWGMRLALHIFLRNKNKKEDYRYQDMRKRWGKRIYLMSYLQVFMLQGFLMWLISLPLVINGGKISVLTVLGLAVWILGFYFEAKGDKELSEFLKNPDNKGKIMDKGLWAITRHPNYFGEVTMWWGIWIVSIGGIESLFSIIGPVTITFLILKVSGIPLLEKKYEGNKLYEDYKKRVNMFWPRVW